MKKLISLLMLVVILISNCYNLVYAVSNVSEAYIQKVGEAEYHIKYYRESLGYATYIITSRVRTF